MSDVVELNEHRLLCGDATKKEDVDRLIDGVKVNLLLTDPPYGIDIVNIGRGQLEDKEVLQLDHSNKKPQRERANGNNWRSQTTNLQTESSEQWEHPQNQDSTKTEGGQ